MHITLGRGVGGGGGGGGHGMFKKYYRPRYYCFFFAFQSLVYSFFVFHPGFVVKKRIAFHPLSKSNSPRVRGVLFFLKLFKALIFLNNSYTKSV